MEVVYSRNIGDLHLSAAWATEMTSLDTVYKQSCLTSDFCWEIFSRTDIWQIKKLVASLTDVLKTVRGFVCGMLWHRFPLISSPFGLELCRQTG